MSVYVIYCVMCVSVCTHVFMRTHMHIFSPVDGGQRSMFEGRDGRKGRRKGGEEGEKEERT